MKKQAPPDILWNLKNIMFDLEITNFELALELAKTPSAIAKLKRHQTLPRVNGAYINSLLEAINKIRRRKLRKSVLSLAQRRKLETNIEFHHLVSVDTITEMLVSK